jgi:hypothetical protein
MSHSYADFFPQPRLSKPSTQGGCAYSGFQSPAPNVQMDVPPFIGQQIRALTILRGNFDEAYIQTKITPGS